MKLNVYSFKDIEDSFKSPFVDVNDQLVIRHTVNALKKGDNEFAFNPDKFQIYYVGSFDTDTGIFESDLRHVADVKNLVELNE